MNKFFFIIFISLMVGLGSKTNCWGITENSQPEEKLNIIQNQLHTPFISSMGLILLPSIINENLPMVFFISGDGGWTNFDQNICEILSKKGMPVIGLNSRKYFWKEKQPALVADDVSKTIEYYMKQWKRNSFVLVGYSFGACVVPFIAPELISNIKESLKGVYCFSPDETGDFEIHISDLLNIASNQKYDVLGQMRKIKSLNPICIFGNGEDPIEPEHFSATGIRVELLQGDHHYNNDCKAVATIILKDF
jgi:type IV secretory pathway VirJ component